LGFAAYGRAVPGPFLHPFARPASEDFTTIVRGSGAAVWDAAGNRYVDALASLWFCGVGHGRASVAEAIGRQAGTLAAFHTFERFTNEPAEQLAEVLVGLAPMAGARVFFTSSGSEAVDSAMKLSRMSHVCAGHPEKTIIIGRSNSYHGVTYGGLSAQGIALNKVGFGPLLDDVEQVDHADIEAAARLFAEKGDRIAAVIAEPVIGAGGVHPPAPGYLAGLRRLCDDHGAHLILDEVICGFGRLGAWWGAQRYDVRPDLVTFAKGVTSGYVPLGGVLLGPGVHQPLAADPAFLLRHGHTYSGHATACAAALAVIDIIREESLADRAAPIGTRIESGLQALVADGLLDGVRGDHGIWAALVPGDAAQAVRDGMLTRGVISRYLGTSVVALCPPLVIDDADLDRCIEALHDSLVGNRDDAASV
jgi:adenosylmethionine-8-amino-7-oxononanoate aminotransferase